MLFYLLLLVLSFAEPTDPILIKQELIPSVQTQIQSNQLKLEAKKDYFQKNGSFAQAFFLWRLDHQLYYKYIGEGDY